MVRSISSPHSLTSIFRSHTRHPKIQQQFWKTVAAVCVARPCR